MSANPPSPTATPVPPVTSLAPIISTPTTASTSWSFSSIVGSITASPTKAAKAFRAIKAKAASYVQSDPTKFDYYRKILQDHGGTPHVEKSIKFIVTSVLNLAKGTLPKSIMQYLPEAIEGLLTAALANIAQAAASSQPPPPAPNSPKPQINSNLLSDILTHLVSIFNKHVQGIGGAKSFGEQLRIIEQLPTKKEQDEELLKLFMPLHKDLMAVAFPQGCQDFGMSPLATNVVGWALSFLEDPANLVALYSCTVDSLCNADARRKQLNSTSGGKILLHIADLASDKTPVLLLDYLSFRCKENTLLQPFTFPLTEAQSETFDEKADCFKRLTSQIEFASEHVPAPLKDLSSTILHSAITKLFLFLSENKLVETTANGTTSFNLIKTPLKNADPFERVIEHLKIPLKKFYKDCSPQIREKFGKFRKACGELLSLESQGPLQDPILEANRQQAIQELKKSQNEWYDCYERLDLTEALFTPLTKTLLQGTGLNKVEGLKLDYSPFLSRLIASIQSSKIVNILSYVINTGSANTTLGNLNETIFKDIIPYGLLCLVELGVTTFPGLLDWTDPETQVKNKSQALNTATGTDAYGEIAKKTASLIAKHLVPPLLKSYGGFWSPQIVEKINSLLPLNLALTLPAYQQNATQLQTLITKGFNNIGGRAPDDQIIDFIASHIEEALLDTFLKNCSGANPEPLSILILKLTKIFSRFHSKIGPKIAFEFAKLPANPSQQEFDNLFAKFQPVFEKTLNKLLEKTGLKHIFDDGKLTAFSLNQTIQPILQRLLFDLYLPSLNNKHQTENYRDQLCELLKPYSIHSKTLQEKRIFWDDSGTGAQADTLLQASNLLATLIETEVPTLLKDNSKSIASFITSLLSIQGTSSQNALLKTIEAMFNNSSSPFQMIWPMAKEWVNSVVPQLIINAIASTPPAMPRAPGEHRQWSLMGDLITRITKCVGECFTLTTLYKKEMADLKIEASRLTAQGGQIVQLASIHDKIQAIYKKSTAPLISMFKGITPQNDPLNCLPISNSVKDYLWSTILPAKLGDLLIETQSAVSPDVHAMQNALYDIYQSTHMSECCRYLSRWVSEFIPDKMRETHGDTGKMLFGMIETFLRPHATGPTKALMDSLLPNKSNLEEMFSHNINLVASNMDRDGVMRSHAWPAVENTCFPLLLTVALKFSKKIQGISKNDPDNMIKLLTGLLNIVARYLKKMNEITTNTKKYAVYELSPEEITNGFGVEAHPGIKQKKNASPEEIRENRMREVYIPFTNDILEFLDFKPSDINAPSLLQNSLFNILSTQIGPIVFESITGMLFKEDGKEATLDKVEEMILNNMEAALTTLANYTTAAQKVDETAPPTPSNAHLALSDKLLKQCAGVLQELVHLIPEYFAQKLLSISAIKKLTSNQLAALIKQLCNDWPLVTLADVIAEKGLPTICNGHFVGKGKQKKFIPDSLKIQFKEAPAEEKARLLQESNRARENKNRMAKLATDGIFICIKLFAKSIADTISKAFLWLSRKIFGIKHGANFHKGLAWFFDALGNILGWIFAPIFYVGNWLLYTLAIKDYSRYAHNTIKHKSHIQLVFKIMDFIGLYMKNEASILKTSAL